MIRLSGCLLEMLREPLGGGGVPFIKGVQTHLGHNHVTSDGGGRVGWVICCRHDFFFCNPFIVHEFFLEVCICLIFFSPFNTLYDFVCVCVCG